MVRRIRKNRKGDVQDLVFILGVIMVFALAILFSFKIMGEWNTEIQSRSDIPAVAKTANAQLLAVYPGVMDNAFLFLVVGMSLAALALAALVRIHPIFIPFYLIVMLATVILAAIMSNVYQEIGSNALLTAEVSQLTFVTYIMNYLPMTIAVFGTILMVVMYKNWRVEQL